jgi:hypothetical protein
MIQYPAYYKYKDSHYISWKDQKLRITLFTYNSTELNTKTQIFPQHPDSSTIYVDKISIRGTEF